MNELKELEILMGWKNLCNALNISKMTLWRWKQGLFEPKMSQWKKIIELLETEQKKWK